MEGFTVVDGVVAVVIVLSALLAYSRGIVREALAIAGWVVAAILAYMFAPQAQPLMQEIPVVGEFLQGSCEPTHGLSDTLLSILAARTSEICAALDQKTALYASSPCKQEVTAP